MGESVTREVVTNVVSEAKERVLVVGTVPFDIEWERVFRVWAKSRSNPSMRVRAESDNCLFAKAFATDSASAARRVTQRQLSVIRDRAVKDLPGLYADEHHGDTLDADLQVVHLEVPLSIVDADGRRFTHLSLPGLETDIKEITPEDDAWQQTEQLLEFVFADTGGGKFSAEPEAEALEIFDHDGKPRGVFPRASFYDTDYTQLVVWALILDRNGRLLIHRRADNAKDNRGMWDKSVGGHVDPEEETSRTVVREVIEELFVDEMKEEGLGFQPFQVKPDDVVYMGEWRPDIRGRHLFKEARQYGSRWYYVKIPEPQLLYSPRTLPDGTVRGLRVRADVFLFVASPILDDSLLDTLKNSVYKLIDANELKSAMDIAQAGGAVSSFDHTHTVPRFSPDLVNIMTGKLRDELQEFAELVRRYATG